jgi:hypothetical protein
MSEILQVRGSRMWEDGELGVVYLKFLVCVMKTIQRGWVSNSGANHKEQNFLILPFYNHCRARQPAVALVVLTHSTKHTEWNQCCRNKWLIALRNAYWDKIKISIVMLFISISWC